MTNPRVTIGLPVYNGERYLADAIDSVLSQTFTDLELVVADNASTDSSAAVARAWAARDPRVRVLSSDRNRGAAWNYNRLVPEARGELFRWHAHDDLLLPSAIERCVAALDADPGAVLAHTYTRFIDAAGEPTRDYADDLGAADDDAARRLRATIRHLTYCNPVFGVVRTDALARTARIGSFVGSDVTLLYELSLLGRFAVVPDYLFLRRPGNSLKSNPTGAALRSWFDPTARQRRPIAVDHALATVGAIGRAPLGPPASARAMAVFVSEWPVRTLRRSRRRRARATAGTAR